MILPHRLRVLLNASTNHENFLLILQNRLSKHTAQLNHVWYKNHMDFMYYTNEDGTSFLFTRDYYYKKDVSAGLQNQLYRERFPEGPYSTRHPILKVVKRLRETGCVASRPRVRRPRILGCNVKPEDILAYVLAHPQSSTKMISENCGLSKSHVWTILNESGAHPYQSTVVQGLLPRDAERHYTWRNFVMNNLEDHPTFLADIVWTDEACFSRNGMFNKQKVHT
ncbi:hypothetical protein AVEN_4547-1 [Araneus ventricosus]|uniref:DUF4817 domain-containing protein n=1 Tax=Araneus ventricosus TaxID=182803 RepID=A0A4Y2BN49_ARAVE|nr:hypothetical protein AVEN_4547-1 [Araneus ventricosus]